MITKYPQYPTPEANFLAEILDVLKEIRDNQNEERSRCVINTSGPVATVTTKGFNRTDQILREIAERFGELAGNKK